VSPGRWPTTLATASDFVSETGIFAQGGNVYWADVFADSISMAPIAGGAAATVLVPDVLVESTTLAGPDLYFWCPTPGSSCACLSAGTVARRLPLRRSAP
jgi:hypothetical protein